MNALTGVEKQLMDEGYCLYWNDCAHVGCPCFLSQCERRDKSVAKELRLELEELEREVFVGVM